MFCIYSGKVAGFAAFSDQRFKIEELGVEKMLRTRVHQCAKHHLPSSEAVGLPAIEKRFDLLALQPVLTAAKIAGNDRIAHRGAEFLTIGFGHVGKRTMKE